MNQTMQTQRSKRIRLAAQTVTQHHNSHQKTDVTPKAQRVGNYYTQVTNKVHNTTYTKLISFTKLTKKLAKSKADTRGLFNPMTFINKLFAHNFN